MKFHFEETPFPVAEWRAHFNLRPLLSGSLSHDCFTPSNVINRSMYSRYKQCMWQGRKLLLRSGARPTSARKRHCILHPDMAQRHSLFTVYFKPSHSLIELRKACLFRVRSWLPACHSGVALEPRPMRPGVGQSAYIINTSCPGAHVGP